MKLKLDLYMLPYTNTPTHTKTHKHLHVKTSSDILTTYTEPNNEQMKKGERFLRKYKCLFFFF